MWEMQILQEQISVHVGNTSPALNARTGLLVPYGYSGLRRESFVSDKRKFFLAKLSTTAWGVS